jgi:hypothetical protein
VEELTAAFWREWHRARNVSPDCIPANSCPIPWFGDRNLYQNSETKVISVGVNPGPLATLAQPRDAAAMERYCNKYRFDKWFSSWETVLNQLGASFTKTRYSQALHTDLSPIMTSEIFSKLEGNVRSHLLENGVPLLGQLGLFLKPEYVVASFKPEYFDKVEKSLGLEVQEPFEGGIAHRCSWTYNGVEITDKFLWIVKNNINPVSYTKEVQAEIGQWANEWE